MLTLQGTVENIIYSNDENGYTVCDIAYGGDLITLTGYMPNLAEGEQIAVHGEWVQHIEYGDQFKVEYYERIMPSTEMEIQKYLSSGLLPGIGKATAKLMVEAFGSETLNVIEHHPDKLLSIKGLSKAKVDLIYKKYVEQICVREVVLFFQKYDVSPATAIKVFKVLGPETVNLLRQNPYLLTEVIQGFSFKTVDNIGKDLGVPKNAYSRIAAGIQYLMYQIGYLNGHTFLPRSVLVSQAVHFLEIEQGAAEDTISQMLLDEKLVSEDFGDYEGLYLALYYQAEKYVADRLKEMAETVFETDPIIIDELLTEVEKETGIVLAKAQEEAVRAVFETSALVITGGPGTGKTTIINSIIRLMGKQNKTVMLAAPTGRAAKRMSEVCHTEAKTIHRLLEITPGVDEVGNMFARNEMNTLDCDVLIVDEMSMVDILLMKSLLAAIPRGAKLVMVGDSDQLPSVGPGNVLKDIIESETVYCVQLREIFRQAKESMIVVNAHKINNGEMPHLNDKENDFFLVHREDPYVIAETIADLCARRLPKAYQLDNIGQIQVLTPTRKSIIGVQALNTALQERLNPPDEGKAEKVLNSCTFRVGDKVMQIKNNYQLEWRKFDSNEKGLGVFNGDVGFIMEIDNRKRKLFVAYDDRCVAYDFAILDELELAYAVTVHKSQGSEFDVVVIPLFEVHRLLMTRNLLYTAITRAKNLVVLVGQEEVIHYYISNDNIQKRYSGLKNKLIIY